MRFLRIGFSLLFAIGAPLPGERLGTAGRRGHPALERRALMLRLALVALLLPLALQAAGPQPDAQAFEREVDLRLQVPVPVGRYYAKRLDDALERAAVAVVRPQYVLLVDRSPHVQAGLLYWRSPQGVWQLVGAAPVATGRPGAYEYFLTPLGAFAHSLANLDFRAEGTRNALGIRGYGVEGMRVYDFGWVEAERTWDGGGESPMRLQMHSTDPDLLEPQLGSWHSKGCIRIPASLNRFIDRHGLLDADYETAVRAGHRLWMLRADREPTPTPGRWLVVVDSQRSARPPWAQPPTRERG